MIVALKPDLMVTFNHHHRLPLDLMQANISHFMNRMQREVLGRYWNRLSPEERPSLIGMAEHLDTNTHVHAALRGQEGIVDFMLSGEAEMLWRRAHQQCGQLHRERTRDVGKMASYITKTMYRDNSLDLAVYYTPQTR